MNPRVVVDIDGQPVLCEILATLTLCDEHSTTTPGYYVEDENGNGYEVAESDVRLPIFGDFNND